MGERRAPTLCRRLQWPPGIKRQWCTPCNASMYAMHPGQSAAARTPTCIHTSITGHVAALVALQHAPSCSCCLLVSALAAAIIDRCALVRHAPPPPGGELWARIRRGQYSERAAARLVRGVLLTLAQAHAKVTRSCLDRTMHHGRGRVCFSVATC